MPNHIHGIIIINKTDDTTNMVNTVETPNLGVSTNKTDKTTPGGKNPKWKPNTLGTIINQYKRICTIHARKINPDFAWQPRYYDHIIRNQKSFNKISEYIINNPIKWDIDKYSMQ
jgi:REP element-mobilizing transposase RayT